MAVMGNGIRMGVSISDQQVVQALDSMAKLDRRNIMRVIGADMKLSTVQNFRNQSDPVTGRKWTPLRPITVNSRPKKTNTILQDTSRLIRSINAAPVQVTNNSAQIGTNVIYGRIQQQGGVITAKKGKYLTIPVTPEAKRAGTFKRFWDQCVAKGQSPAIVGKAGRTKVMIYYKGASAARSNVKTKKTRKARKGKETVGFILKRSVVIPRRRFMGFSFKDKNKIILRFKQGIIAAENRKAGNVAPAGKDYW